MSASSTGSGEPAVEATSEYDPASHYDRVTAAWQLLLGDELHCRCSTAATSCWRSPLAR